MTKVRTLTVAAAAVTLTLVAGRGPARGETPPVPVAGWSGLVPRTPGATHHYADPAGKPGNAGTREAPWDLASAVGGRQEVEPGDVIWVRGGTYTRKVEVRLVGKPGAPVIVRAYPGERATVLDQKVALVGPAAHVWLWGLEIAGSAPVAARATKQTGSFPTDLPPGGGLDVLAGAGHRFIDLVIHDNVGGAVGWWTTSTGGEIHGCLIYGNGWKAPDRKHGHCIYAQNKDGVKTISSCILSVPDAVGSHSMHAYGSSKAYVDNFLIEDNIVHGKGPFLVGGGRPSHNIKILRNYLYKTSMRIGYGPQNEDCEVRGNVIAGGSLKIDKYRSAVDEGNVLGLPARRAVLIPDRYDPDRAHLVVYNGAGASSVPVDASAFLKPGDSVRLMAPEDVFGKPVHETKYGGGSLDAPMTGADFAAFVVLKDTPE